MNETTPPNKRSHRTYSVAFKAQIAQQCNQPGVSVAGVALSHGINPNLVHRWRRQAEYGLLGAVQPAFIPLNLDTPPASTALPPNGPDIRVHLQKGSAKVAIHWPVESAQTLATWLNQWLA